MKPADEPGSRSRMFGWMRSPGFWLCGIMAVICLLIIASMAHMFLMIGHTDSCFSVKGRLTADYCRIQQASPGTSLLTLLRPTRDGRYIYQNQDDYPITITSHGDDWIIDVEYDSWLTEPAHAREVIPKDLSAPVPAPMPTATSGGTVGSL